MLPTRAAQPPGLIDVALLPLRERHTWDTALRTSGLPGTGSNSENARNFAKVSHVDRAEARAPADHRFVEVIDNADLMAARCLLRELS
jgi:hypothetical protein